MVAFPNDFETVFGCQNFRPAYLRPANDDKYQRSWLAVKLNVIKEEDEEQMIAVNPECSTLGQYNCSKIGQHVICSGTGVSVMLIVLQKMLFD